MNRLHLIRVPISTRNLAQWAGERGWVQRYGGRASFDEGRALHHLLDEVFGAGVLRPFRLLVPPRRAEGNLYGYSGLGAEVLGEAACAHALPDHLCVIPADRLESKPMPEKWKVNQRIGFDLRTRPVRRVANPIELPSGEKVGKGAEMDAFLLEALREFPDDPRGMQNANRSREAVYLDWLAEKMAPAANVDLRTSRLARFNRNRVARGERAGLEGPDATIQGTLTVTDPAAFSELLSRGIGRHRAYGYGMVLLRPPNRCSPER